MKNIKHIIIFILFLILVKFEVNAEEILFSVEDRAIIRDIAVEDEDIIRLNLNTGSVTLIFDGDMLGLNPMTDISSITHVSTDIMVNSREVAKRGDLIFSVGIDGVQIPGITVTVNAEDLVRFHPTAIDATGRILSGIFSLFFDASDVGLDGAAAGSSGGSENLDGAHVVSTPLQIGDTYLLPGDIIFSTISTATELSGDPFGAFVLLFGTPAFPSDPPLEHDLLLFKAAQLGDFTQGREEKFVYLLDASATIDTGSLVREDINAVALVEQVSTHGQPGDLILSINGTGIFPNADTVTDEDLVLFAPDAGTGLPIPSGTFFQVLDGSTTLDFVGDIDAVSIAVPMDSVDTRVAFDHFIVNRVKLVLNYGDHSKDWFSIAGEFQLGTESNGINLATEDVSLQLGMVAITIPAGSFQQKKHKRFNFHGTIAGIEFKVDIRRRGVEHFRFRIRGKGADLNRAINPPNVGLNIGDDGGSTVLTDHSENGDMS